MWKQSHQSNPSSRMNSETDYNKNVPQRKTKRQLYREKRTSAKIQGIETSQERQTLYNQLVANLHTARQQLRPRVTPLHNSNITDSEKFKWYTKQTHKPSSIPISCPYPAFHRSMKSLGDISTG